MPALSHCVLNEQRGFILVQATTVLFIWIALLLPIWAARDSPTGSTASLPACRT